MPYRKSQKSAKAISKIPLGIVEVSDLVSQTNLPGYDFAINPYVGCPHACRYCYAYYIKDVSGHSEEWGEFVDMKLCDKSLSERRLSGKRIFLSSTSDVYNPKEKDTLFTRSILEQLSNIDCQVHVNTKSDLVIRDIDVLSRIPNISVGLSLNTLDDNFRSDMDRASSVNARINAMQKLHDANIYTICFISPIFPNITNWKAIIEATREFCDEWWFEDLNLRGAFRYDILAYISDAYPHLESDYYRIYKLDDWDILHNIEREIVLFCENEKLAYLDAFHHPVCPEAGSIKNRTQYPKCNQLDSLF